MLCHRSNFQILLRWIVSFQIQNIILLLNTIQTPLVLKPILLDNWTRKLIRTGVYNYIQDKNRIQILYFRFDPVGPCNWSSQFSYNVENECEAREEVLAGLDKNTCYCEGCPMSLLTDKHGKCCCSDVSTASLCRSENVSCVVSLSKLNLLWNKDVLELALHIYNETMCLGLSSPPQNK